MIIKCAICSKEFDVIKYLVDHGRKYCSRECCYESVRRKPKLMAACQTCGKEFRTYHCDIKIGKRKFCSRACIPKSAHYRGHGESNTRLHGIWCHMKTRCKCPTSPAYGYYGGRGIQVCQEWDESYETFRDWALLNGYTESLELDRINVDGNYEPTNCRWATRVQQMRNTRKRKNAKTSKYKGVSKGRGDKKWRSQICLGNGSPLHIGMYETEIEAAVAYDQAARIHFGEYVSLNFPNRKEA